MTKIQKNFKNACWILLFFAFLDLIEGLLPVLFVNNLMDMLTQTGIQIEAEILNFLKSNLSIIPIIIAVGFFIGFLFYVWAGLWGLKKLKNRNTGLGAVILGIILGAFLLYGTLGSITKLSASADLWSSIISLLSSLLTLGAIANFIWCGLAFRREAKDRKSVV